MRARWMSPETGTFLSVDPLLRPANPQSHNAYAYAYNNPVNRTDPTGMTPFNPDASTTDGAIPPPPEGVPITVVRASSPGSSSSWSSLVPFSLPSPSLRPSTSTADNLWFSSKYNALTPIDTTQYAQTLCSVMGCGGQPPRDTYDSVLEEEIRYTIEQRERAKTRSEHGRALQGAGWVLERMSDSRLPMGFWVRGGLKAGGVAVGVGGEVMESNAQEMEGSTSEHLGRLLQAQ